MTELRRAAGLATRSGEERFDGSEAPRARWARLEAIEVEVGLAFFDPGDDDHAVLRLDTEVNEVEQDAALELFAAHAALRRREGPCIRRRATGDDVQLAIGLDDQA